MLTEHPSAEVLSRFALGLLPEDELESLAEHLEACPACQRAVPTTAKDEFIAALCTPLPPEPHSHEPECAAILADWSQDLPLRLAASAAVTPPPASTADWPRPAPPKLESFSEMPCVFGRYRLERRLGSGGMGTVFLAQDTLLERSVALKVSRFAADQPQAGERFLREARAAASLQHDGICRILDCGIIEGTHYLTMEYIEGEPLSARLTAKKGQEQRWSAELVRQAALAMEAAHRHGLIHRDLKPANLMLDAAGKVRVVDFGLARRQEDEALTQSGVVVGTPLYMSPERIRGDTVGPATDIYSLGVILYEMLTGQRPFSGKDPTQLAYQIAHAPLKQPSRYCPGLDNQLEAICLKALARDTSERYASMTAFAADLEAYLHGASPLLQHSNPQEATTKSRQSEVRMNVAAEIQQPPQEKLPKPSKPRRSSRPLVRATARIVGCSLTLTIASFLLCAVFGLVMWNGLGKGKDNGSGPRDIVAASGPKVLIDEDFKEAYDNRAKSTLPKNWEGDAYHLTKEGDEACLESTKPTEVNWVKLPPVSLDGDFLIEGVYHMSYNQAITLRLENTTGNALLPIIFYSDGRISIGDDMLTAPAGFKINPRTTFVIKREGKKLRVLLNGNPVIDKDLHEMNEFDSIKLSLYGQYNNRPVHLFGMKVVAG